MKATINFYDEKINIILPQTFEEFKYCICERFSMELADVNELLYSYLSNDKVSPLSSESDFQQMLKCPNFLPVTINVEVNPTSKLFKKEEKNFVEKCQNKISSLWGELNLKENICKVKDKTVEQFNNLMNKPKIEEQSVHQKVVCDGCGMKPIVGVRFKCTVCPNFDYCENCEKAKANEHKHPFLKIRKPELAPAQIQCILSN